jgi:plastocyanin
MRRFPPIPASAAPVELARRRSHRREVRAYGSAARKVLVSLRGLHPLLYLAALALGVVSGLVLPASASAQSPSAVTFTAVDDGSWDWETTGGATSTPLAFGGTVMVVSPSPGVSHNARLTGPMPAPSCMPDLPASSTPPPWSSACTFNTSGTYMLICDVHNGMTSTINVDPPGGGNPPPSGGNPPPGGNPPGGGGSGGGGGGSGDPTGPGGTPTQRGAPSFKVTRKQTGVVLRGSVTTSGAAKIVVTALVSNRYLSTSRPKRVKKVSVGSKIIRRTSAGKASFAVRLNAAARRALNRREKLAVSLRIVVTPTGGRATTKTVAVAVRAD